jgi:hypothetical protein
MKPKRKRPSFSSLNEFIHCQLKHFLDCSTPRQPDTPPQARGKHVHNLLQFAAERVLGGSTWKEGLQEGLDANLPGPCPLKRTELQAYVFTELADWLEPWTPIQAEEWIEWPFDDGEAETLIVGKIDLQAHKERSPLLTPLLPTVLDYKCVGHAGRVLSEADAQRSLQLKLYCLFKDTDRAGFVYILPTGRILTRMVSFNREELTQTRTWLALTLKALRNCWKTGVWAPAAPDHPWCSARHCPHWNACLGNGKE